MSKKNVKEGYIKGSVSDIGYRISGTGKDVILCFNGIGVAKWIWEPLEQYFSQKYKIITWDYPGHGSSKQPKSLNKVNFKNLVHDAFLIIDQLKLKRVYLVGHSAGLQIALEVMKKRPSVAKGLISCLGTPGRSLENFMDSFAGQTLFDIAYILNAVVPELSYWITKSLLASPLTYHIGALLKLVNPSIKGGKEIKRYLNHIANMNLALFNQLIATGNRLNTKRILTNIKIPTLLIASENDQFVPMRIAKEMGEKIKEAELFIIKNGTHAALLEQPDIFNLCIEKFLSKKSRS